MYLFLLNNVNEMRKSVVLRIPVNVYWQIKKNKISKEIAGWLVYWKG